MFVSGITGAAGMSFIESISPGRALLLFLASFLSYGFGQALTDCFQTDTDSLSSPYRPLVRGLITTKQLASVSISGLFLCVFVFSISNPVNLLLGMLGATGLATYTAFKRRWWSGPFYNAWIVVVLFLMANNAILHSFSLERDYAFFAAIAAVLFGYANFVLGGYFKDIEADRATGYNTMPVVWGRRMSALVSDVLAVIASGATVGALAGMVGGDIGILPLATIMLCLGGGVTASIMAQIRLHGVTRDAGAHAAIVPLVHAYVLLLSAIVCAQKPAWAIPLAIHYVLFVAIMRSRPEQSQI